MAGTAAIRCSLMSAGPPIIAEPADIRPKSPCTLSLLATGVWFANNFVSRVFIEKSGRPDNRHIETLFFPKMKLATRLWTQARECTMRFDVSA
jgi:hypothetical protein